MLKKAVFVLCSAVFVVAIAGCDGNSNAGANSAAAQNLPDNIKPFEPPKPGDITPRERPGSSHSKTTSGGGE